MSRIDHHRTGVFFGTLLVLAIAFEVVLWTTDVDPNTSYVVYMFTPMVAALVVVYRSEHSLRDFGVRAGNIPWLGGAILVGLLVAGLTVGVSVVIPGIHLDVARLVGMPLPSALYSILTLVGGAVVFGATLGAVLGFGEEFGWRGYLLWELTPLGFWRASVVIGTVWGIWHVPSILQGLQYASFPYVGIVVFIAATIALSPVYTYVVCRAESVFAAAIMHGIFNATSITISGLLTSENTLLVQLVASTIGVAGIVACLVVWGLLYLRGTPTLDRETFYQESSGSSVPPTVTRD